VEEKVQEREASAYLAFFAAVEPFKDTLRNSWTSGGRRESAAEHSWRLALMALTLAEALEGIDTGRLLAMLVVHDLGEVFGGDVPAPSQTGGKAEGERADFLALLAPLPGPTAERLAGLWDEYERGETPEARIAKALDKLETCLQHVEGTTPDGFDYAFNLGYGRRWRGAHPALDALRALVDRETERLAAAEAAKTSGTGS
jgi:putative hydrolases of HD superfamily